MERVTGIEPVTHPWEGRILPLNHTRNTRFNLSFPAQKDNKMSLNQRFYY